MGVEGRGQGGVENDGRGRPFSTPPYPRKSRYVQLQRVSYHLSADKSRTIICLSGASAKYHLRLWRDGCSNERPENNNLTSG